MLVLSSFREESKERAKLHSQFLRVGIAPAAKWQRLTGRQSCFDWIHQDPCLPGAESMLRGQQEQQGVPPGRQASPARNCPAAATYHPAKRVAVHTLGSQPVLVPHVD